MGFPGEGRIMDVGMAAPTRIGTEVAGFRIDSVLGRGGMSVVYVAEQTRLGRKVALKVLTTELAWDETFREYGGDDTDLGLRVAALGIPFVYEPRATAYHMHTVSPLRFGQHAFSEGRAVVRVARKHGLALEAFSGGTLRGPFDRSMAWGWRWNSGAMDRLGRLLTTGLATADLVKVQPAQVFAARLVRRFYRVGGITREIGSGIRAGARSHGV